MAEPNKLKVPGESTTNPSFASPNIQTAPDVAQSQAVAGNAPTPTGQPSAPVGTPQQSSTVIPPAPAPGTGNVTAPTPSATVSSATPSTAAPATVPASTGAPPGVPNTGQNVPVVGGGTNVPVTPTVALPPTMKSLQGKNAAENDWIQAQNENNMKLYEAALAYNGGPTGALQEAQRRAESGLRSATSNRGAAGTIESSLFGEDKGRISTQQALSNTKAYNTYQEAVNTANALLNKAQVAFARATEQEKREIVEAAERKEQTEAMQRASQPAPQAAAAPSGFAGGVVPHESVQPGAGFVRVGMPLKKW